MEPHYKTLLSGMSDYLPDAQALLTTYFVNKSQAASRDPIQSPALNYDLRIHLQPDRSLNDYGIKSQLQHNIADMVGYLGTERRKPEEEFGYGIGRVYH